MSVPVVLLGAGASADAKLPMAKQLTDEIVAAVNGGGATRTMAPRHLVVEPLNFVVEAMRADAVAAGAGPALDFESVYGALALLARGDAGDVSPFVTWHPKISEWQGEPEPRFKIVMNEMQHRLRESLDCTGKPVGYLEPLVTAGKAEGGITVATLNYDRTVEEAGKRFNVDVPTYVDEFARDGQWPEHTDGVRLLKLHGSLNWVWDHEERGGPGRMEGKTVVSTPTQNPRLDALNGPALLIGHGGKLRAEGPFLSMLAEFEKALLGSDRLVIVGYSFRDDHVNEIIRRWLSQVDPKGVAVIDPYFPEFDDANQFQREMMYALDPKHSPNSPFTRRLKVIRESAEKCLPEISWS